MPLPRAMASLIRGGMEMGADADQGPLIFRQAQAVPEELVDYRQLR